MGKAKPAEYVEAIPAGYMGPVELGRMIGVSESAIRRWGKRGHVHYVTVDNTKQWGGAQWLTVFNVEQAQRHYEQHKARIRTMRNRKCSFDASDVGQSEWELRRHYMALYRCRLVDEPFYPAHLCGPEIEQLLVQGHAELCGQGYRLTWEGIKAWARMNEAMLKRKVSRSAVEWRELRQALNADM
jgi:hypothetical protein